MHQQQEEAQASSSSTDYSMDDEDKFAKVKVGRWVVSISDTAGS